MIARLFLTVSIFFSSKKNLSIFAARREQRPAGRELYVQKRVAVALDRRAHLRRVRVPETHGAHVEAEIARRQHTGGEWVEHERCQERDIFRHPCEFIDIILFIGNEYFYLFISPGQKLHLVDESAEPPSPSRACATSDPA